MGILIAFGITAVLLSILGVYIWKKKAIHLLSNFNHDPQRILDKAGLARWAGYFLIIIAGFLLFLGASIYMLKETPYEMIPLAVSIPLFAIVSILYIVGGQRFLKK